MKSRKLKIKNFLHFCGFDVAIDTKVHFQLSFLFIFFLFLVVALFFLCGFIFNRSIDLYFSKLGFPWNKCAKRREWVWGLCAQLSQTAYMHQCRWQKKHHKPCSASRRMELYSCAYASFEESIFIIEREKNSKSSNKSVASRQKKSV